jgi:hypothetical protein
LHLGELRITGSGGNVFCDEGVTAGTCGTSTGLTTGTAYGLGVANGRLDGTETLTLALLNPIYHVKLVSFSLTGFSDPESAIYNLDGTPTTVNAPVTNVALDTFSVNGGAGTAFTNSVVWSVPAGTNYSLASMTLDVTVPEPTTFVLGSLALLGLGIAYRRKTA